MSNSINELEKRNTELSSLNDKEMVTKEFVPASESIKRVNVNYKIVLKTGSRRYAGTKANVFITLYDENSITSGPLKIDTAKDLKTGSTRESVFAISELGRITKIEVSHDNSGEQSGWFLEQVVVEKEDEVCEFTVKQWLSNRNHKTHPSLIVKEDHIRFKYNVVIETGDVKDAGTDSRVSIQLFGENGLVSHFQTIDTKNYNDFMQGSLGSYIVYSDEDLGQISNIKIEHDNTGASPWWYIKKVIVNNQFKFVVDDWLGSPDKNSHPSKRYSVEKPEKNYAFSEEFHSSVGDFEESVIYEDASLLEVATKSTTWQEHEFDNSRQVKTTVKKTLEDNYKKIRLYSNGFPYAYHCRGGDYVGCGVDAAHSFMGWFNSNIPRSHIKSMITTHENASHAKNIFGVLWEGFLEVITFSLSTYDYKWNDQFYTVPSELKEGLGNLIRRENMGFNATVVKYRSLNDKEALNTIIKHLESGMPVIALINEGDHWVTLVGVTIRYKDDEKTIIDIENTTVDYINFTTGYTGYRAYPNFDIVGWESWGDWVYGSYVDGTLISLNEAPALIPSEKIDNFEVFIRTANAKRAGTNSKIYITLYGDGWESEETRIDSICNDYERSEMTKGIISAKNCSGPVVKIKVRSDGSGERSGWLLKEVFVRRDENLYNFTAGTWLEKNRLTRIIDEDSLQAKYRILVKTGDKDYAGTDSGIFIKLFGETGIETELSSTLQQIDNLGVDDNERGSTSRHDVYADKDMLAIEKIYIETDNSGPYSGWFLDNVTVQKINQNIELVEGTYNFTVNKWLDSGNSNETVYEDLLRKEYRIEVQTGNAAWAGTNARVYIKLYGDRTTEYMRLDNSNNNFENGDTDSFSIVNKDVGQIDKIEVKHDNSGNNAGWFLEKVKIIKDGDPYVFTAQRWLSDSVGNKVDTQIIEDSNRVQYKIEVTTGTVNKSGTDSGIYIKLFGEDERETVLQRLNPQNGNDFENGQTHTYIVYSDKNLNEIDKIYLESDNAGINAGWYVETIKVTSYLDEHEYIFNANSWLSNSDKSIHPSQYFNR